MTLTLEQLNTARPQEALHMLDGLYEHSPWIAQAALLQRPFKSVHHLKHLMTRVLEEAGVDAQVKLICAHPELAGKAMVSNSLTAESSHEQSKAGLTHCSADEFTRLQQLNADYKAKFGFPFILAVRGPRGTGLNRFEIIATFERRLQGHPDFELQECLRNIHRIAEIRLNDKFGLTPTLGNDVWDWQEELSQYSEAPDQLTVTYLTQAHRACAAFIQAQMLACGFDSVHIDAVGNVVGCYEPESVSRPTDGRYRPKTLLTGSHYDTVRNGGKYDGRLGIFVPMACVRELKREGKRLPFHLEVIGFAEEEGQRFKATFLGSGALTGDFSPEWLDQVDADGVSLRTAMTQAHLCESQDDAVLLQSIGQLKRDPAQYLGFVEVHIEQGPVLNALHLPLGVVTSINASVRYTGEVIGQASHAGTTPMNLRSDAVCAVSELALYLEQRAAQDGDSVATMGQLNVPQGSVNVVPGRCTFSLDLRAPNDLQRNAIERDVLAKLALICKQRGLTYTLQESMRASAAPSAPVLQQLWEMAVSGLGLPIHRLPSGAGHDAMKLFEVMPQAMLFVRGQNAGISHNPLESTTSDDMQLAVEAFSDLLHQLAAITNQA
jgi:N-carbamoyl-L-amino-acid hydrolase